MKISLKLGVLVCAFIVIFASTSAFAMSDAEKAKLKRFENELNNIDKKNFEAAIAAEGVYVALFSLDDSEEVRVKAFELYFDFYEEVANTLSDNLNTDEVDKNLDNYKIAAQLSGYTLYSPEGAHVLGVNYNYLYNNFATLVSKAWTEYLYYELYAESMAPSDELMYYEGPFETLRTLIVSGEYIKKQYPNTRPAQLLFPEKYIQTYIGAAEFVQIYDDRQSQIARKEVVDSYEKFITENKNSEYYNLVLACYNNLKKNNMKADFANHTRVVRELYSEMFD